jgi:hypothetical protein
VKKRRFESGITTPQREAADYEIKGQIVRPGHTARWGKATPSAGALCLADTLYNIYFTLLDLICQANNIKN